MRVLLPLFVLMVLALVAVQFGAMMLERRAVTGHDTPDDFTPQELPQFKPASPGGKSPPKVRPNSPDSFRG